MYLTYDETKEMENKKRKGKLKEVSDVDLKFSENALKAYLNSNSECIYIEKNINIDDDTEIYLFLDNDFEMSGTRKDMNEYFEKQYAECYENEDEF